MIYRLLLSYRGTAYAGWQRQANGLAVQQVVEEALGRLLGHDVRVAASSRTDAGVHARGQVAHLEIARSLGARVLIRALVHGTNHFLPTDVRVLDAQEMAEGFHARRCATGKEYRYRMSRAPVISPLDAWFTAGLDRRVDLDKLRCAAERLVGRHDFAAFAKSGGSHSHAIRELWSVDVVVQGERVDVVFRGDGFLRGMVRSLVGALLEVGLGRLAEQELAAWLTGEPRGGAGRMVPAHGLVLQRVFYPDQWGGPELEARDAPETVPAL